MAERDLTLPLPDHIGRWQRFLAYCQNSAAQAQPLWPSGRLTRINGLVMEATGLKLPLGSTCRIVPSGGAPVEAEVVGFANEKLYLMPSDDVFGLAPGAKVEACDPPSPPPCIDFPGIKRRRAIDRAKQVPVGNELLGRVLDGVGRPLDNKGPIVTESSRSLQSRPFNPMMRASIDKPLDVGIRAINSLLTVGRGQRMGLFAGSGVGKSVLLGMMARYTEAEVIVVGLIGERGREVKEFIEQILGQEGLRRSVVVAAPGSNVLAPEQKLLSPPEMTGRISIWSASASISSSVTSSSPRMTRCASITRLSSRSNSLVRLGPLISTWRCG